jgi:rod shape-determining protein MreC
VVLVLVSVTLITFDERSSTHSLTSGVKSVAHDVFSPFIAGVNAVLRPVGDFFAGGVHYGSLQQENQQLQKTVGDLQAQLRETQALRDASRQVLNLKDLPFVGSSPTVVAEMTNINVSNFDADITVDKGRSQGVAVGMPVVGAGGLVGQVIAAYHNSSVVQLITDSQSTVGVMFGPGDQTYATVTGQGTGRPLSVGFVAPGTPLTVGEKMFTSGLSGGEYPPGIPVGVVHSYRQTVGSGSATVTMTPLANLNQLAFVEVVQWEPQA